MVATTLSTVATGAQAVPSQVVPSKYSAIVVDTATGQVLYQVSPDTQRYPASLTKMMTLYVMFEELERGRFKLTTPLRVSALAQRQSPTKLGLRAGETITVEDAIKGLITRSANDAAAVIAENVAGSVPAFADRMTRTARAIGMSRTRFRNANGLPDPGQYTTARDMMKLGVALQVRFPQYYPMFSIRSYTFRGRTIGNHNNLLGRVNGVDGIKTGYVNASGFNLVTSVKRDGRKIVAVVMGGKTAAQRDAHMVQLINTYLPKASRARGYDDNLVAAALNAPKVAGGADSQAPAEPARLVAASTLPPHPTPVPRPMLADAGPADADPANIVTASIDPADSVPVPVAPPAAVEAAAEAAPPHPAEPVSLATATLPASLANARLPSSAAEAFADIGPAPHADAMADLVARADAHTRKTGGTRGVEVASAAPVAVMSDAQPAVPVSREAPAAEPRPSGWYIQIGAVGSKDAAMDLLGKAKAAAGRQLAAASPFAEAVSKGGSTVVRARFGGFASEKAANQACATLKKNAFACFTIRL